MLVDFFCVVFALRVCCGENPTQSAEAHSGIWVLANEKIKNQRTFGKVNELFINDTRGRTRKGMQV